jgi:hypothetical protein
MSSQFFGTRVAALILFSTAVAAAQIPTGAIAGSVSDSSGARVAALPIEIHNRQTGSIRMAVSTAAGGFDVSTLPAGEYLVVAQLSGFKRLERGAVVHAGVTTVVDLVLQPGELSETVSVSGNTLLLGRDHHQVSGVVTREQIEHIPLNGRHFLELAKLQPGVTSPQRGTNNRTFVAILGAGLQSSPRIGYTRVTVDGASIIGVGAIGAVLQLSQDAVQEFQMSTVNFDASTGLTSNGAVNIVTRSGTNDYHGSGFAFYRDHRLSAYPGLAHDAANPDPFFRRAQFGSFAGGPLRREKAFIFAGYERNQQMGVVSVQPRDPAFASLGGVFHSPYLSNQFTVRIDGRAGSRHNLAGRHSHDDGRGFAPLNDRTDLLPSAWSEVTNLAHQTLTALTSVFSASIVNDLRVSSFFMDTRDGPGTSIDCPGCFGLGTVRTAIPDSGVVFGNPRTLTYIGRRTELSDVLTLHRGDHRVRLGFTWEHSTTTLSTLTQDPAQLSLWGPSRVRQLNPAIALLESYATVEDVFQLPLTTFTTGVGSATALQAGFRPYRVLDLYRVFVSDTWRASSGLTVNAGMSWSYEPNALNHDLTKPALLLSLLGQDGLRPPAAQLGNWSPTLGLAWSTADGRTVVRGGAGRYFDPAGSANAISLADERTQLAPYGTGRLVVSGSNILWNGRPLNFRQPTMFTGADLLNILPMIRADLAASLNPANRDLSTRNIDRSKEGTALSDPFFATPYAVHLNVGMQRQFSPELIVSADVAWRQFVHTVITDIDYNRWLGADGPVIPRCDPALRDDVAARCSNGPITFDATIGRARYKSLLLRADRRLAGRGQLTVSYALGSYAGTNGTAGRDAGAGGSGFNNDNWLQNYGPLSVDRRHILNASGFAQLPLQLKAAVSVSVYSRAPFSAYVGGVDFNGDGTSGDLLPGTTVNQFNRGLNEQDLHRLVEDYNQKFARRITPVGQLAPVLRLPDSFALNDAFFAADVRLSREFHTANSVRFLLFADVFNLFNTANLINYSGNLANTASFGQPAARFDQVFGSGGPRSLQLGARVSF